MRQELLAPAGSLETFYAVIAAGANAVYLGGPKFGARAYAKNFTEEECIQAIHYAHLKNVKVYMTVNTLVKNTELEECINSLMPYYKAGLDGVIVQDLGVLAALQQTYPGLELHASTQMSISNKWGAMLLKRFGVNRVVPSRELSLPEINRIRKEADIEVETFVHGALCYSYSGNCLMSSLIGGRSGNRGRCAQPCRLAYELLDEKKQSISKSGTLLSLKDLSMLKHLPDLALVPVDSLKIEGRMKQTEYAYTVVSLYRKYLDICEKYDDLSVLKKNYSVDERDWKQLLDSGNREGFTNGYYYDRNNRTMITKDTSSHNSSGEHCYIPKEATLPMQEGVDATLFANLGEPLTLLVSYNDNSYTFQGPIVEGAQNKPTTIEQIEKQMKKTGNSLFFFKNLDIQCDENVFLPVSVLNEFRRNSLDDLLGQILHKYIREETAEYRFSVPLKKELKQKTLSVSGNLRAHLSDVLNRTEIDRVYIELDSYDLLLEKDILFQDMKAVRRHNKECILAFPYIFRRDFEEKLEQIWCELVEYGDGFIVRSLDSLGFLLWKKDKKESDWKIIGDETLYTYSDNAVNVFSSLGCEICTIPYELNKKEMEHHFNENSELVIYGKYPLMITANCVKKTCNLCKSGRDGVKKEIYYLKDRKNARFPVEANCNNCGNIIYNSVPVCLMSEKLDSLKVRGYRIHITDENQSEINNIFDMYKHFMGDSNAQYYDLKEFTYGHFKRGVE